MRDIGAAIADLFWNVKQLLFPYVALLCWNMRTDQDFSDLIGSSFLSLSELLMSLYTCSSNLKHVKCRSTASTMNAN